MNTHTAWVVPRHPTKYCEPYRERRKLTFQVEPVPRDIVESTRALLGEDHMLVLSGPRGPRGGWPTLRYLRADEPLPKRILGCRTEYTVHVVVTD
ncbi:hypothetical protein [Burkholderia sp. JKS000303]|uniref:hypothetical protein n=1 Tax=Burkholderia sp. JKS000303 TaxID=1938747 RepID=UPI000BF68C17|nr:hypothetical protein [Burkholderia sp. JKS000303]PFH12870.1 hypothetical protein BX604_7290 [Burkholderia sp. JKS000303]